MSKQQTKRTNNTVNQTNNTAKQTNNTGKKSATIIDCENFDVSKFSVEKWEKDTKFQNKGQYMTFPRYQFGKEKKPFVFKTKPIKFVQYGVKKIDGEFIKSDEQRDYMKIPFDENQPECVELFKMFETIDEYFKKNIVTILGPFGTVSKLYSYQPIIRSPPPKTEDDGKPDTRMKYAKIKFSTNFNTKELDTKVYSLENNDLEKYEVKNMSQLEKHLRWNGVCKFIITASKVWIGKSVDPTGKKRYGIAFKCPQMVVVERPPENSKEQFSEFAFEIETNDDSNNGEENNEKEQENEQQEGEEQEEEQQEEQQDEQEEEQKEEQEEDEEQEEQEQDEPEPEPEPEPVKPVKPVKKDAGKKPVSNQKK